MEFVTQSMAAPFGVISHPPAAARHHWHSRRLKAIKRQNGVRRRATPESYIAHLTSGMQALDGVCGIRHAARDLGPRREPGRRHQRSRSASRGPGSPGRALIAVAGERVIGSRPVISAYAAGFPAAIAATARGQVR